MSEDELLAELDLAIDQQAAVIFVEANPLFIDFADQRDSRACDGWSDAAVIGLVTARRRVAQAYRWLAGRARNDIFRYDPEQAAAKQIIDEARNRRAYPFQVRDPCNAAGLSSAFVRARGQATRIVLVLPPRSPAADHLLGETVTKDLRNRATSFAARHRLEMFVPEGPWQNDEFVDIAHLNEIGRAHFLKDLRRWWAQGR